MKAIQKKKDLNLKEKKEELRDRTKSCVAFEKNNINAR